MKPFLLGPRGRRLFGIYAPAVGARRRHGMVLCPPAGQEYLRSHRSLVLLGKLLTRGGYDVLRFDYFGTGDSAGAREQFSLTRSVDDVVEAVRELQDVAAVRGVTLVGLRLGGTVAALAADRAPGVDRLVLWEVVADGASHVGELRDLGGPLPGDARGAHVQGFPFPSTLLDEIESVAPAGFEPFPGEVLLLAAEERAGYGELGRRLAEGGGDCVQEIVPDPPCWIEDEHSGTGAIPTHTLQRIASWQA